MSVSRPVNTLILKVMRALNYQGPIMRHEDPNLPEGICEGHREQFKQALLLGEEEIFYERIDFIIKNWGKISQMFQAFEQAKKEAESANKPLIVTPEFARLIDLQIFLDSIELHQETNLYFNKLWRIIKPTSLMIEQRRNLISGPVQKFCVDKLIQVDSPIIDFLNSLRQKLSSLVLTKDDKGHQLVKENRRQVSISLSGDTHTIHLHYCNLTDTFYLLDVNFYSSRPSKFNGETDLQELANGIYACLAESKNNFNLEIILAVTGDHIIEAAKQNRLDIIKKACTIFGQKEFNEKIWEDALDFALTNHNVEIVKYILKLEPGFLNKAAEKICKENLISKFADHDLICFQISQNEFMMYNPTNDDSDYEKDYFIYSKVNDTFYNMINNHDLNSNAIHSIIKSLNRGHIDFNAQGVAYSNPTQISPLGLVIKKNRLDILIGILVNQDNNFQCDKAIFDFINMDRTKIVSALIEFLKDISNQQERVKLILSTAHGNNILGKILNTPKQSFFFLFSQNKFQGDKVTKSIYTLTQAFANDLNYEDNEPTSVQRGFPSK